jgi:type IV pilus assembly protein PilZ
MADDDPSGGAERRRSARHPTRIDVDVDAQGTFLFAEITDISSMGIFIHADEVPPTGTVLTLVFGRPKNLEDGQTFSPFRLQGEVVWTTSKHGNRAAGMGAKFLHLPDDERRRLMDMVNAIAYFDE